MKALILALLIGFTGCASRGIPDRVIVIESHTEPLELEADAGPPHCSVRAKLNGTEVILRSWAGCYVIRKEVAFPKYDNIDAYKP